MNADLKLIISQLQDEIIAKGLILDELVNERKLREAADLQENIWRLKDQLRHFNELSQPKIRVNELQDEVLNLQSLIKEFGPSGPWVKRLALLKREINPTLEDSQILLEILAQIREDPSMSAVVHLGPELPNIKIKNILTGLAIKIRKSEDTFGFRRFGFNSEGQTILRWESYPHDNQILEFLGATVYEVLGYHWTYQRDDLKARVELLHDIDDSTILQ